MLYIVGGGITGLTLAYLHSEVNHEKVVVYTDKVGGQMKSPVHLGPRILDYNKSTEKFMKSLLGSNYKEPEEYKIGYYNGSSLLGTLSETERKNYLTKLGRSLLDTSALSDGKNLIKGWDMYKVDLLGKLESKVEKFVEIKKLTLDEMIKLDKDNKVISTIPTIPGKKALVSWIGFYDSNFTTNHYSYVYDTNIDSKVKRYTEVGNGKTVAEISVKNKEDLPSELFGNKLKATVPQIYFTKPYSEYKGIKLDGRMATLDHHFKLEDTVVNFYEENNRN